MNRPEIVKVLEEEIERLHQVRQLLQGSGHRSAAVARLVGIHHPPLRRVLSADGRRRIVEAQQRRWAREKRKK